MEKARKRFKLQTLGFGVKVVPERNTKRTKENNNYLEKKVIKNE